MRDERTPKDVCGEATSPDKVAPLRRVSITAVQLHLSGNRVEKRWELFVTQVIFCFLFGVNMNFSHANKRGIWYLFKLFLGAVSKFSNELPRNFLGRNPREISTARPKIWNHSEINS